MTRIFLSFSSGLHSCTTKSLLQHHFPSSIALFAFDLSPSAINSDVKVNKAAVTSSSLRKDFTFMMLDNLTFCRGLRLSIFINFSWLNCRSADAFDVGIEKSNAIQTFKSENFFVGVTVPSTSRLHTIFQ